MPAGTIGRTMDHGFAGMYGRQPDHIAITRPNGGSTPIVFGRAVMQSPADANAVQAIDSTLTVDNFVGVAKWQVKGQDVFAPATPEDGWFYKPQEAVPVMQRGSINVWCKAGTPVNGGGVHVRMVENAAGTSFPGDFEAAAVTGETLLIPNLQWVGPADSRGVAEVAILSRSHA